MAKYLRPESAHKLAYSVAKDIYKKYRFLIDLRLKPTNQIASFFNWSPILVIYDEALESDESGLCLMKNSSKPLFMPEHMNVRLDSSSLEFTNTTSVSFNTTSIDADLNFPGSVNDDVSWFRVYDWENFRSELRWALPIHVYGFACLFFMLSFYTFFSILNLRSQLSIRPFMSTINVFVCILGLSRSIFFLVDPYCSQKILPELVGWVLWDVGYPCILSAFALIQLAFSQLTQMTFRPESLRKQTSLSFIITMHFFCVLSSNVVSSFELRFEIIRVVIKVIFLGWGIVLCFTFLHGGGGIMKLLKTLPNSVFHSSQPVGEHKGILQLALLAQCNNIASSVITTAAAPSLMTPKIKITDENESSLEPKLSLGAENAQMVPEIKVIEAETSSSPIVQIEISSATPETPIEDKFLQEIDNSQFSGNTNNPQEAETGSPKRKKSLTWVDETGIASPDGSNNCSGATLGCDISQGERKKRRGSSEVSSRRSSTVSNASSRKNSTSSVYSGRKGSYSSISSYRDPSFRKGSHVGEALVFSRKSSISSEVSRRSSGHGLTPAGINSRRESHKSFKDESDSESLLRRPSASPSDVTLSSVLNHIAYVNQTQAGAASSLGSKVKESRKEQVRQVLIVTYVSAVLGLSLSLLLVIGMFAQPPPDTSTPPWLWFVYESTCRTLEFLIGCALANITRQPVNRHSQYGYNLRMKTRNSIYLG